MAFGKIRIILNKITNFTDKRNLDRLARAKQLLSFERPIILLRGSSEMCESGLSFSEDLNPLNEMGLAALGKCIQDLRITSLIFIFNNKFGKLLPYFTYVKILDIDLGSITTNECIHAFQNQQMPALSILKMRINTAPSELIEALPLTLTKLSITGCKTLPLEALFRTLNLMPDLRQLEISATLTTEDVQLLGNYLVNSPITHLAIESDDDNLQSLMDILPKCKLTTFQLTGSYNLSTECIKTSANTIELIANTLPKTAVQKLGIGISSKNMLAATHLAKGILNSQISEIGFYCKAGKKVSDVQDTLRAAIQKNTQYYVKTYDLINKTLDPYLVQDVINLIQDYRSVNPAFRGSTKPKANSSNEKMGAQDLNNTLSTMPTISDDDYTRHYGNKKRKR